jgi:isocitrate/isopropylmalate dehydrogenase
LRFAEHKAGALHNRETGEALPDATFAACRDADAILFGAMGWPDIRYADGTESRRNSICVFASSSMLVCVRPVQSRACRYLSPRRAPATSIWFSCAKTRKGCSPRAARACGLAMMRRVIRW